MANSPRCGFPEIVQSQPSKYITHNQFVRGADALVMCAVIDKDLTGPPGGESDGDTYIVAGSGGGSWGSGAAEDDIAYYENTAYVFYTPLEGWLVFVQDENLFYVYNGAAWEPLRTFGLDPAYDVGGSAEGPLSDSEVILRHMFVRDVDFSDDFAGSDGFVEGAPDSEQEFSIQKWTAGESAAVEIGTMTFGSAGIDATFGTTSAGAPTFESGDILMVVAPASADTSLTGLAFRLKGTVV